jgi:hypothetical protein
MAMHCAYCPTTFGAFGGTVQVTVTTGGGRLQNPPDSMLLDYPRFGGDLILDELGKERTPVCFWVLKLRIALGG